MLNQYIVKEVIYGREQEPYISHKLQSLMESEKFKVLHYENKDIYLGNTQLKDYL